MAFRIVGSEDLSLNRKDQVANDEHTCQRESLYIPKTNLVTARCYRNQSLCSPFLIMKELLAVFETGSVYFYMRRRNLVALEVY